MSDLDKNEGQIGGGLKLRTVACGVGQRGDGSMTRRYSASSGGVSRML